MKKSIILLLILITTFSVTAQKDYSYRLRAIPITNIPFNGTKIDRPQRSYALKFQSFPSLNANMWKDIQLTIPILPGSEGWQFSGLDRRFTPTNGNYYVGLIYFGVSDFNKKMLFTLTSNDNYIDALEIYAQSSIKDNNVYVKQFKIDTNMRVTVYQLKPTSTTPIMLYSKVTFPLRAQRIDTVYQIDSNGRFSLVRQTLYQPQNYSEDAFTSPDVNIWDGTEIHIK